MPSSNSAPRRFHATRCLSNDRTVPINQTGITKFQSRSTAPGILRHSPAGTDRGFMLPTMPRFSSMHSHRGMFPRTVTLTRSEPFRFINQTDPVHETEPRRALAPEQLLCSGLHQQLWPAQRTPEGGSHCHGSHQKTHSVTSIQTASASGS